MHVFLPEAVWGEFERITQPPKCEWEKICIMPTASTKKIHFHCIRQRAHAQESLSNFPRRRRRSSEKKRAGLLTWLRSKLFFICFGTPKAVYFLSKVYFGFEALDCKENKSHEDIYFKKDQFYCVRYLNVLKMSHDEENSDMKTFWRQVINVVHYVLIYMKVTSVSDTTFLSDF